MSAPAIPSTYRAWQFTSAKGGLEKNLKINPSIPQHKAKSDQHLIQVVAAALNPVDYKPAEVPFFTTFIKTPAIPGIDFAGRIVQPADGSPLKPGQAVFGAAGTGFAGGALGEYITSNRVAPLPEGIPFSHGASAVIAGISAYQSIVPFVKEGSSVFINGGSGGTGTFGIQIAKAKGCYVVTTCSTPNVDLCKSLGADEVIDYKQANVLSSLKSSGRMFDHVVDNVGSDDSLFWKCHEYSKPGSTYMQVGATVSLKFGVSAAAKLLWPSILGGGRRKYAFLAADAKPEELSQLGMWMQQGQVKPIIDSHLPFEEVPKAFEKLKTGRARGKIVVDISGEASQKA